MVFTPTSNIEELRDEAIILIDKPLEWTSFDALKKIKFSICHRLGVPFRKFKVGHAGTLDPLATGLLILCVGKATKQIESLQQLPKTYTGTFLLGATTPSFDLESAINAKFDTASISKEDCEKTANSFLGEQLQRPPIFSAVWVDGKRAYDLARKGEQPALKQKPIRIDQFDIETADFPAVHFKIKCSKGTYIRSIARDFGEKLNNGAHLTALRRTDIGEYSAKDAWQIDDFISFMKTTTT